MIRIDDIQIDEDYYDLLIHLLMKTTGLNLDYYGRNFVEKRIKSRMIRVNSQRDLNLIDSSNCIYMKDY